MAPPPQQPLPAGPEVAPLPPAPLDGPSAVEDPAAAASPASFKALGWADLTASGNIRDPSTGRSFARLEQWVSDVAERALQLPPAAAAAAGGGGAAAAERVLIPAALAYRVTQILSRKLALWDLRGGYARRLSAVASALQSAPDRLLRWHAQSCEQRVVELPAMAVAEGGSVAFMTAAKRKRGPVIARSFPVSALLPGQQQQQQPPQAPRVFGTPGAALGPVVRRPVPILVMSAPRGVPRVYPTGAAAAARPRPQLALAGGALRVGAAARPMVPGGPRPVGARGHGLAPPSHLRPSGTAALVPPGVGVAAPVAAPRAEAPVDWSMGELEEASV